MTYYGIINKGVLGYMTTADQKSSHCCHIASLEFHQERWELSFFRDWIHLGERKTIHYEGTQTNRYLVLRCQLWYQFFLSVSCFASPSLSNLFITSGRVLTWMDDCSEQEGQGVTRTKRLALPLFDSSREVIEFIFKLLWWFRVWTEVIAEKTDVILTWLWARNGSTIDQKFHFMKEDWPETIDGTLDNAILLMEKFGSTKVNLLPSYCIKTYVLQALSFVSSGVN